MTPIALAAAGVGYLAFVYGGESAKTAPARATSVANDASAIVPASHTHERAAAPTETAVANPANSAEVVCVVRNLTDPNAKSDVVVLDRRGVLIFARAAGIADHRDLRLIENVIVNSIGDKLTPGNLGHPGADGCDVRAHGEYIY